MLVWRHSDVLSASSVTTVVTSPSMVGAYYARLEFAPRAGGSFELTLPGRRRTH
jgi:hypothetical protein